MDTTNYSTRALVATGPSSCRGTFGGWLTRRRAFILGGGIVAAVVALALSQHWIAAAVLTQLLFALPCAVMMFFCMKGMSGGQKTDAAKSAADADDKPSGTGAGP